MHKREIYSWFFEFSLAGKGQHKKRSAVKGSSCLRKRALLNPRGVIKNPKKALLPLIQPESLLLSFQHLEQIGDFRNQRHPPVAQDRGSGHIGDFAQVAA